MPSELMSVLWKELEKPCHLHTVTWRVDHHAEKVVDIGSKGWAKERLLYGLKLIVQLTHAVLILSAFLRNIFCSKIPLTQLVKHLYPLLVFVITSIFSIHYFFRPNQVPCVVNMLAAFDTRTSVFLESRSDSRSTVRSRGNKKFATRIKILSDFLQFQTIMHAFRSFRHPGQFPYLSHIFMVSNDPNDPGHSLGSSHWKLESKVVLGILSMLEGYLYINRIRLTAIYMILLFVEQRIIQNLLGHLVWCMSRKKYLSMDHQIRIYSWIFLLNKLSGDDLYRHLIMPTVDTISLIIFMSCTFITVHTIAVVPFPSNLQVPIVLLVSLYFTFLTQSAPGNLYQKSVRFIWYHSRQSGSRKNPKKATLMRSIQPLKAHVGDYYFVTKSSFLKYCFIAFTQTMSLLVAVK